MQAPPQHVSPSPQPTQTPSGPHVSQRSALHSETQLSLCASQLSQGPQASMHVSPQHSCPSAQAPRQKPDSSSHTWQAVQFWHVPPQHVWLSRQKLSHAPVLGLQISQSPQAMQTPLQHFRPAGQTTPQLPQLNGSVPRMAH
jgi:hypothetical protein